MKTTHFEVVHPSGSYSANRFPTVESAKEYLADLRAGHPDNTHMTEENHAFWRKMGSECKIFMVHSIITKTEIQ